MEQFKIDVDQNNILHLQLGNPTADKLDDLKKWTDEVRKTVLDLYNRTGKKVRTIIDISRVKKYDSEALLILSELMKSNEQYAFKTATFGANEYILTAQDALLAMTGRTNFKAFNTQEEALSWLTAKE